MFEKISIKLPKQNKQGVRFEIKYQLNTRWFLCPVVSPLPWLEVTAVCKRNQTLLLTCTRTQTEMLFEKGGESGCQTLALTPAVNIHKKVPVTLKQSRAKRPLLHNRIHTLVHVCLAEVYTAALSGNTVRFYFFGVFSLILCV